MSTWKDGDIIKMILPDGREVYRVVIKAHERYATTLTLFDSECFENEYPVKIDDYLGKFHADTGKIAFTKNWDLDEAQFVRAMGEDEFTKLLSKIGATLMIPSISCSDEIEKKWENQYKELQAFADSLTGDNQTLISEKAALNDKVEEIKAELDSVKAKLEETMEKLSFEVERSASSRAGVIKAEAERDVYKELYMHSIGMPVVVNSPSTAAGTFV